MDDIQEADPIRAEIQNGLMQAREALFGKEDGWRRITYKQLEPLVDATLELGQHFTVEQMLVLGTYAAAMARQNLTT